MEKISIPKKGLKLLSPVLKKLDILNLLAEELRNEAMHKASKMSIQCILPKVSNVINIKDGCFDMVDKTAGIF